MNETATRESSGIDRGCKMSIGANIKSLREERKLTQEKVAEELGVSFQAVSSWERDEYNPDTEKLIKLAELFDVSVSAIVEEKNRAFKTRDQLQRRMGKERPVPEKSHNNDPAPGEEVQRFR